DHGPEDAGRDRVGVDDAVCGHELVHDALEVEIIGVVPEAQANLTLHIDVPELCVGVHRLCSTMSVMNCSGSMPRASASCTSPPRLRLPRWWRQSHSSGSGIPDASLISSTGLPSWLSRWLRVSARAARVCCGVIAQSFRCVCWSMLDARACTPAAPSVMPPRVAAPAA